MKERLIMKAYFGSTLYGTNTPQSDLDIKGLYIPSSRDILLGKGATHYTHNTSDKNQKNTSDDIDLEMFSLQSFIGLATKGETIALDMIHTPSSMIVDYDFMEPWDFIYQNRSKFYTTDMKAYLGYVKRQAAKYGTKGTRMAALRQVWDAIKHFAEFAAVEEDTSYRPRASLRPTRVIEFKGRLPVNEFCKFSTCPKTGNEFYEVMGSKHQLTIRMSELKDKIRSEWEKYGERARLAEKNEGVDWKAMHHAIRGGLQLKEIYDTGDLQYPLKDAEFLKQIKAGVIDFKEVSSILEDLISDVDIAAAAASKNGMPSKVDTDFWDTFVLQVYHQQVVGA
ncbi:nucleotidyltransferase [Acinetobacter phage Acj9]|uniref:Uncharacterized protein nrdC.11 n=1 Tax=Acinetobacter phage Acj9 TaxID=760939 RepID=E5EPR5_9CAUD|nr:nucleotidyltransferase [Acinetobacter phage Acj9]ADG60031.1 hypothetical protein Acj9p131 [Acinetobacter phage Acj9]